MGEFWASSTCASQQQKHMYDPLLLDKKPILYLSPVSATLSPALATQQASLSVMIQLYVSIMNSFLCVLWACLNAASLKTSDWLPFATLYLTSMH